MERKKRVKDDAMVSGLGSGRTGLLLAETVKTQKTDWECACGQVHLRCFLDKQGKMWNRQQRCFAATSGEAQAELYIWDGV